MRTAKIVTSVGGKGLDSSVTLRHLGVETVALCFVAGKAGQELIDLLEEYGIQPEPVWVGGETRTAHVIVETHHHRHSHIIAGLLTVSEAQSLLLLERFDLKVKEADWVICAGSVPPSLPADFYTQFVASARQAGVPILIDSTGAFILQSLPAKPDIVKMNREEFKWTFQMGAESLGDLEKQALEVHSSLGLNSLVITCAQEGILAFTSQGHFHTLAPVQKAVNAAGAGDAVSSALVWRLSRGDSWPAALQWAGAISAATVLTDGTADCHMEDVLRIYPQVRLKQLCLPN